MNIRLIISKIINTNVILIKLRLLYEVFREYQLLVRHLGIVNTSSDKLKLEAKISIASHAIEKGLSLPAPRIGFGENKVLQLLNLIEIHKLKYNDTDFLIPNSIILKAYFDFNKNANHLNASLFNKYSSISKDLNLKKYSGGVEIVNKSDVLKNSSINFDLFTSSRFSIRDFSNEPVNLDIIFKALEIAKKAPSACNRQPWRVYVYKDQKLKDKLLDWQLGSRGFSDSINTAIVINCSLKYYFMGEIHQAYVDGGLYAMSLIYALHSLGVGTIPLTLGMTSNKLKTLPMGILKEKDELPILVIGVGSLKDTFRVAISHRKDISDYVKFIS